jgi:hypothetical protein
MASASGDARGREGGGCAGVAVSRFFVVAGTRTRRSGLSLVWLVPDLDG